jgi:hypothetical protein
MMGGAEWGWNPDAVGAVATAAATFAALSVVLKDAYSRAVLRRRAVRVAQALLDDELSALTTYGQGWQTISILVIENESREAMEADLLVPNLRAYLDNQTHLSEEMVLAAARVASITAVYRKAFADKSCERLFQKRGVYNTHYVALTAEVEELRRRLDVESRSCW